MSKLTHGKYAQKPWRKELGAEMVESLLGGAVSGSFPDSSAVAALHMAQEKVREAQQMLAVAVKEANQHLAQNEVTALVGEALVRRAQRRGTPTIFFDEEGKLILELRYGKAPADPKPKAKKKTRAKKKTAPKKTAPKKTADETGLGSLTALASKQGIDTDTYKVGPKRKRTKTGDPSPVSLVTDEDLGKSGPVSTAPMDEADIDNLLDEF
jgi:hypothetical protein